MEKIKKSRTVLRSQFTKLINEIKKLLETDQDDSNILQMHLTLLEERNGQLVNLNEELYLLMLENNSSEDELILEVSNADDYKTKYLLHKLKLEKCIKDCNSETSSHTSQKSRKGKINLKLPKLELVKFGGEIKDWLGFWGQFQKIHQDEEIVAEDKYQYLRQATVPGSKAREIVDSFPGSGKYYKEAIETLKSRFGRTDILVEFYIREILKIIINNSTTNEKFTISSLYDSLESHLRALNNMWEEAEKCGPILYPLVESCLPEEILRTWQRSTLSKGDTHKVRLEMLMKFLKSEVENEQRITMALSGFGLKTTNETAKAKKEKQKQDIPTASTLITTNVKPHEKKTCIFCGNTNHKSDQCFKAQKMSYEEKKKILSEKKCCFICLNKGHSAQKCRLSCKCVICNRKHLPLMCPDIPKKEEESSEEKTTNCASFCKNPKIFLMTLRIKIKSQNGGLVVRALIDSGSQRSYVCKQILKKLNCKPVKEETVIHSLFGGVNSQPQKHFIYELELESLHRKFVCQVEAMDQEKICDAINPVSPGPWIEELKNKNIKLSDLSDQIESTDSIGLLIGADICGKLFTGRREILKSGMVAIETELGWTLMGKVPSLSDEYETSLSMTSTLKNLDISQLWDLETIGIRETGVQNPREETRARTKLNFLNTLKINNEGRYEVSLPWSDDHSPLPTNRLIAEKRLKNTQEKLKQLNINKEYDQIIKEWSQEGIIEETESAKSLKEHYLPHRAVIKEGSTTRIRPVFDASAKEKGFPSLNQCLEEGPNLIEMIPGILLRFREHEIGVLADIKKAFLQISVRPEDRDSLRFLWEEGERQKIYRHARVVFGLKCSPFMLGATIEYHLKKLLEERKEKYPDWVLEKLMKGFYVDNTVTSVRNLEELHVLKAEATNIMKEARFELRGWESSFSKFENEKREDISRVLGLLWDKESDEIVVNVEGLSDIQSQPITRRVILSTTNKIFDPIGFTCPVTLKPKLILQEIWDKRISWDDEVDTDTQQQFKKWLGEIRDFLPEVKLKRWMGTHGERSIHVFCDASQYAYATVIFLRVQGAQGISLSLLGAKSRVAPRKQLTIPRLELLAALIAARLIDSILKALGWEIDVTCWTDSTTVLAWITRSEAWTIFVANRVKEIRKLTDPKSWRHIKGEENPADLPSRGCTVSQLVKGKWWEGPEWLKGPPESWPSSNFKTNIKEEENVIIEKTLIVNLQKKKDCFYTNISSYKKIIKIQGWILRFINNLRNRAAKRKGKEFGKLQVSPELKVEEFEKAEEIVLKLIQEESFTGLDDPKIKTLNPVYTNSKLIRLKTKISRREDTYQFLHPIVLPKNHPIVNSLIRETHESNAHVSGQMLLGVLREKYWVLGGRRTIRSVVGKCVRCKRYTAKPMDAVPAVLPKNRVQDAAVFEVTGVDFAGPIFLKQGTKAWIALFTCAVYRAVHLELVESLSTDSFLQAFRRFIARRGRPRLVYSDNGTNFVGAERALSNIDWQRVTQLGVEKRIQWIFNPPSAPWWGGWWERLVGLMKKLLRRVLGRACLTLSEMMTVLCDCEAVMNNRPITYVSEDSEDLKPLTPAMFIRGGPEGRTTDIDLIESSSLNKRLKYRYKILSDLRQRFRKEYLGQLNHRVLSGKSSDIEVGDVVLIGQENVKRMEWPLARVIALIPGSDGEIRIVRLKTSRGELLRPIQKLYPLEISSGEDPIEIVPGENEDIGSTDPSPKTESPVTNTTKKGRKVQLPIRYRE